MKEHFVTFAGYNAWANRKIYDAVAQLSAEDFRAPRSGFFPSIARTLNHILVGDRIWLSRFTGIAHDLKSLDQVLYEDFAPLRQAREAEDQRIIRTMRDLREDQLTGDLVYRTIAGDPMSTPWTLTLSHFFNHQTHHRGQVHAMLSSTSVPPPPLDLIYYLRETA